MSKTRLNIVRSKLTLRRRGVEKRQQPDETPELYTRRRCWEGSVIKEMRPQQWEAIDHLVSRRRDVVLIAKTSFSKGLIFHLAPLLQLQPAQGQGIALILIPLNLLLEQQAQTVKGKLDAECCVLT